MAAIDKIYGTKSQWVQFVSWLIENKPSYLRYIYPWYYEAKSVGMISHFETTRQDRYLMKNCDLKFIRDKIRDQYNFPKGRPLKEYLKALDIKIKYEKEYKLNGQN